MSILTKPINPLSANIEYEFELSVAELLVLVQSITTSDYWEDIDNWRAVDFVYVNSQKQYQRIVFDLSTNEVQVDFAFNQNSINGVFQCGRITVFGYVNDSLRIKRSFYDDEFDIVIVDGIDLGTTIVITSVTPPAFSTYSEGDVLTFTLNFSDLVNITGLSLLNEDGTLVLLEDEYALLLEDTQLVLLVGSEIRYATYVSGSESANVVYEYVVQAGDQDLDGIEILSLDLNGGTIIGVDGSSVNIAIPTTDTSGILIDNSAPDVIAPTILSITAVDGDYKAGDNLYFTATFSEPVVITGTPYLLVDIGGTQVQADMTSNNSADATFSYTVLAGQLDLNGVQVLSLDSAVITDNALNLLDRTLPTMDMSLVRVDAVAPSITSISAPADDNYTTGEVISFVANFSENVIVTGTPFLQVLIGSSVKQFDYVVGGSGTNALTFSYTVLSGDLDENGISFSSTSIQIPSATIRDAAGNNATVSFTAPTTIGITVNFIPVTTNPISIAGNALYSLKYNSFDNNLYITKVNTLDPFQSPGLYVSNNEGLTYTQKTPVGINAIKEVTSTGNAYSTNLSISDSGIYQSLNSGVTFNLADNVFTNTFHDVKYYSAGNKIFGVSLTSSVDIGYVWEGNSISINRIPFQTTVGSPLINTYITNIHLENNLMYLGTETGLCISNLNTDLTYFDPSSFGGEKYVLSTASATLPLNNVTKVIANGLEVYAIISDTVDPSDTAPRTLYYSNNSGTSFSGLATPSGVVQNIIIGNYVYILVLDAGQRRLYRKEGSTFVLIPLPQNDAYLMDSGDDKVFIGNITGSSLYIVNDV